ncbi:MFS transporter [Krasilnikovia sp. MM14-A1004]|uniref:MFS transporter n=1 Tax=Krasilnikovia sp. MM14-A1004 TaxID=3373541 RepID=UPI00399C8745
MTAAAPPPATVSPDDERPEPSLWRNGGFQALWISRFLATVGKESAEVAYPLLILATTGSATYAGAVGATQLLVVGVMSIPGGALTDRFDRRRLLIICDTARVVLLGLFAALVAADRANLAVTLTIVVAASAFLGLSNPPALAAIKQLVPASQVTRAAAQNQIRPLGATVVGSPIGSSLFAVGRAVPFLATGLTFVCSALALLFIRRPLQAPPQPAEREEPKRRVSDGFRFIRRQPILLVWIVWLMGSNMAFNHTGAFLALIATARERHASEAEISLMLSVAGAGGLVGAAVATQVIKRWRPSTIFLVAAWAGPVAAVLLATVPGVLSLGVILACVFLRGPSVNALFFAYVAVLVPDALQGRVLGAVMFLSYIAQPLGIVVIGAVFDHWGPDWVFVFMGVVSALVALPTLGRRIRTLPPPAEAA